MKLSRTLRYAIDGKAARDTLQNSEARFRAMSDASPLGIFVSDAGGSCVYTNAAYQRISGLSFKQTLGMRWSMAIHPEDRPRVLADWRAAAQSGAPFRTEFRFQRKVGSVSHLVGAALALAGAVVLVVVASRRGDAYRIVSFSIYGATLFLLYLISTLYHGLPPGRAKWVFQVLDHQAIYLLIAGDDSGSSRGSVRCQNITA